VISENRNPALSLKLFKEPKDNLPCMIAYQVFFLKNKTKKTQQQNDMHPVKGASKML